MSADEDLRMALIRDELLFLNDAASGVREHPIVKSVAKAMAMAQLHPDIEARVVCSNVVEAQAVAFVLAKLMRPGERVDPTSKTLEFPNGSAVRVVVEAMGKERRS